MIASANGTKGDASGAMRGKISALASLESELRGGLRMAVISMMTRGRLSALLRGELVDATMIRP
jgi:isopentenyl phosphate kinase